MLLIKIDAFGIPEDTDDSEAERILKEESGECVHIATLTGHLIQNGAMIRKGFSPVQMCDDYSFLLVYAMKALTEPYRDSEFVTAMVEQIPNILFYTSNVYPDMVVYYPCALPYGKYTYTIIKEELANLAHIRKLISV